MANASISNGFQSTNSVSIVADLDVKQFMRYQEHQISTVQYGRIKIISCSFPGILNVKCEESVDASSTNEIKLSAMKDIVRE